MFSNKAYVSSQAKIEVGLFVKKNFLIEYFLEKDRNLRNKRSHNRIKNAKPSLNKRLALRRLTAARVP